MRVVGSLRLGSVGGKVSGRPRGSLMCDVGNPKLVLCDYMEGWGGEGEGRGVRLWPILVDIWHNHHSIVNYPPVIKSSAKSWW